MSKAIYDVRMDGKAPKLFVRLPRNVQRPMQRLIDGLASDPRPQGSADLKGQFTGFRRAYVGIHYRVVYWIDDEQRVVHVTWVGSRENVPYD